MTQETKHTRHDKPLVDPVRSDASNPDLAIYRIPASGSARAGLPVDDPIPLFLSGPARDVPPSDGREPPDSLMSPRMLRAAVLAVTAAALGFAVIPAENLLAVFANAEASLASGSVAPPKSAPAPAASPAAADQSGPTRDEITGALRAALVSQPETLPPAADTVPARKIDAEELASLLKRARNLIASGDIAAARLLLERAAGARAAGAALLLAQTYDPAVLGTPDTRSIIPDPAAARSWYQQAARFGSLEAQQRLDQMKN